MRRMFLLTTGLVASVARTAAADVGVVKIESGGDLPANVTIDLSTGVVRQGAYEVALTDLLPGDPFSQSTPTVCNPTYGGASYERATGSLVVDETGCAHKKLSIARSAIVARLARAAAWSAESRGDLATAKRQLEAALIAEPGFERATFDLARVELRLGDRSGAAATLRPIIARAPVARYVETAADPTFAQLLDELPLSDLRTPTPGTARVAGLQTRFVARSTQRDLLAIVREVPIGDGDFDRDGRQRRDIQLVLFDPRGSIVAVLSLLPSTVRDEPWTYDDLRDAADPIAVRLDAADRVLRDLGFDPLPDAEIARFRRKDSGTNAATFPHARLGVAERDGTARLLDHDRTLAAHVIFTCGSHPIPFNCDYPPTFVWAAWLPSQHLVLLSWHTSGAEHSDRVSQLEVWQVPAP